MEMSEEPLCVPRDIQARIVPSEEHDRSVYFFGSDHVQLGGASRKYSWLTQSGKMFTVLNADRTVSPGTTVRRFFKFAKALACIQAFLALVACGPADMAPAVDAGAPQTCTACFDACGSKPDDRAARHCIEDCLILGCVSTRDW